MEIRNKLVHTAGGVSTVSIDENVKQLLLVIEKLGGIFQENFEYNGLDPLPKTIKIGDLNLNSKLLNKSMVNRLK